MKVIEHYVLGHSFVCHALSNTEDEKLGECLFSVVRHECILK